MYTNIEQLKQAMTTKRETKKGLSERNLLSTGCTLLNLNMTGRPDGGWVTGHYFLFVGDSDSGKSWFMHTALAEASINPTFDDHRLIYDNTEVKSLMDIGRFFGQRCADRIEPPRLIDGDPTFSQTTEEFYYHLDDAVEEKRPFIYILDSQDSLSSERESTKFDKKKSKARGKKNTQVSDGDYSDGKAKSHSSNLRQFMGPLADMNSLLIVVNQARDSFSMYERDSYSGGRALKYYSVAQLWSYNAGMIHRDFRGIKRQLGIRARIKVKKNHITGKMGDVEVPIYHSHGIDDVGCNVDYLLTESVWKKNSKGIITATGLGPTMELQREKLIRQIEEKDLEEDLAELVGDTWEGVQKATAVKRKPRYE